MKSIRFLSLLLLLNLFAAGGYAADHPVKKEIAVLTQPHFHLAREERLEVQRRCACSLCLLIVNILQFLPWLNE